MKKIIEKLKIRNWFLISYYLFRHPRKFWNALSAKGKRWAFRGLILFLIILIGVPTSIWLTSKKTEAAWWNDMWMYRKPIAVTNSSGGILTDFQVKILSNVNLSTDITAGKVQADLDDLRFTDINGNLLPYWLEDTTTTSVDAWIKMPTIPTSGATVYMYYGNSSATSYSDGNRVFEFFDDFSGSNLDTNKWSSLGTVSVSSGIATMTADAYIRSNATANSFLSNSRLSLEGSMRHNSVTNRDNFGIVTSGYFGMNEMSSSSAGMSILRYTNNAYYFERANDSNVGAETNKGDAGAAGSFHRLKIIWEQGASAYYETPIASQTLTDYIPSSSLLYVHINAKTNTSADLDWVFIRKNASTDPFASAPATEEKGTGPVAYWSFDEGYGTTAQDKSQNNYDGTISGATWKPESECVSEKCLYFAGNTSNYVDYGNIFTESDIKYEMTASAWFKADTLSQPDGSGSVVSKSQYSVDNSAWTIYVNSSGVNWTVYNDNNSAVTQSVMVSPNTWNHVVAVWNNGSQKLYLNGALISSSDRAFTKINDSTGRVYVGIEDTAVNREFKGFIDEVKIYKYERSAAQIKLDYNAGIAGTGGAEGASATFGGKSQKWLTDGLVGHWKMDESSENSCLDGDDMCDSSGNNYNGINTGTPAVVAGKYGNARDFNPSTDFTSMGSVDLSNKSFTLSAWAKRDTTGRWDLIWGQGIASTNQGLHVGFNSNNALVCNFYGNDIAASSVTDTNWHHFICTFDSSNKSRKIYLDGNFVGSNIATANYQGTGNLKIAGSYNSDSAAYDGKIDEVRVYNRALSPDEVSDLYNYAPGPVGHWKMDENTGTLAYDTSGNNNTGTITAATWGNGKFGSGLSFNGSSTWVQTALSPSIPAARNYTQELWFYPTVASDGILIDDYNRWEHYIQMNSNRTVKACYYDTAGAVCATSTNTVTLNTWNHISAVIDSGNSIKVYVNGILWASNTSPGGIQSRILNDVVIGAGGYDHPSPFAGQIDDVKIYNYARTPDQIKEDMLGRDGSSVSDKSAIGYWKFDEGYGSIVNNSGSGGSESNGTLTGATWSNSGKLGKAMSFNGTSSCVSHSNIQIGKADSWSFSTWQYKPTGSGADWQGFIGKSMGTTDGGYWMWHGGTLTWYQDYYDPGGGYQYYGYFGSQINLGDEVPYDRWFNLLVTYNGSNYETKVYIDGVLRETRTATWSPRPVSQFTFYGIGCASGRYFNGLIDETKVYNYALTPDEVALDYNQGKSMQLGSSGTTATGAPSNSEDRKYCPPGDMTATCGPVGEWKLDENTGTAANDSSGNGNNGTITNGPTWVVNKSGGPAVNFDGSNDYITIADSTNSVLDLTSSMTIESWIKVAGYKDQGVVSKSGSGGNGLFSLSLGCGGNQNKVKFGTNGGCGVMSNATLQLGTWYHVVGVYDGSTRKIYVNGILDNLENYNTNMTPNNDSVIVGSYAGTGYNFNGVIDDVKIYNYARTPAQIAWDYNRGAPVGWWKMDDGEGLSTKDSSGNNNHGTLTNMDGATDWVTGKINKALDFDGSDDYVSTNFVSGISSNQLAVSAWVKPNNTGSYEISNQSQWDGGPWTGWRLRITGSQFNFKLGDNSSNAYELTAGNVVSNSWQHVLGVWDGSYIYIYLNGKEVGKTNKSFVYVGNTGGHFIGKYPGAAYYFPGQIDDVRIYNYALTADQIEQIYNGGAINFR